MWPVKSTVATGLTGALYSLGITAINDYMVPSSLYILLTPVIWGWWSPEKLHTLKNIFKPSKFQLIKSLDFGTRLEIASARIALERVREGKVLSLARGFWVNPKIVSRWASPLESWRLAGKSSTLWLGVKRYWRFCMDKSSRQEFASFYPLLYVSAFHTCNLCVFTFLLV